MLLIYVALLVGWVLYTVAYEPKSLFIVIGAIAAALGTGLKLGDRDE
jgi:hypothetical protein